MLQSKRADQPQTLEEIESVCAADTKNSRKSIRRASTQLHIPRPTIHKVLHKSLRLYAYNVQLFAALTPALQISRDKKNLQ